MPGGDGTGPAGQGPMTGRAGGYCAGYGMPGYLNFGPGRGFWGRGWRRGRGGGRGWGRWRLPDSAMWGAVPLPAEQEAQLLKAQAQDLEDTLNGIRRRIAGLEAVHGEEG
ncbi:MAG: DUF5320 domain-containing protein [Planctomycetes bacterium]|nr:DUF5320 domain-containing protein [Planctomycetota bacterium]